MKQYQTERSLRRIKVGWTLDDDVVRRIAEIANAQKISINEVLIQALLKLKGEKKRGKE